MRRALLLLALTACAVALLAGCGGGGGSDPLETARYLPLSVGNAWRYSFTDYSETAGVQVASVRPRPARSSFARPASVGTRQVTGEDVVRITGTVSSGGSTWYRSAAQYVGSATETVAYMRHTADGLLRTDSISPPDPYVVLGTPVDVGTTWANTVTITSVSSTVSVTAGVFTNCVVVDDVYRVPGQPDDTITSWYAPGVGLVREEHHVGDALVDVLDLISYTVNE